MHQLFIILCLNKLKDEWDEATQRRKQSTDITRYKTTVLNPNFQEAMDADEADYNEAVENDDYQEEGFDAEAEMEEYRAMTTGQAKNSGGGGGDDDEDDDEELYS